MQKNSPVNIESILNMIPSLDLSKSVASDLTIPDPTGIIAKGQQKANENSKKYDRGTGGFHHIEDLFPASE
jgi:hypothetical protein